jgi:hypothetical protein
VASSGRRRRQSTSRCGFVCVWAAAQKDGENFCAPLPELIKLLGKSAEA